LPELSCDELTAKLGDCFTVQPAGEGPEAAESVWQEIEAEDDQGLLGLFSRKDQRWLLVRLTDVGRNRLAQRAKDHSEPWRELGVSVLHRLIIEDLLGATELPKPKHVHLVEEVVEGIRTGEYPLAALVMPAGVQHIRTVSLGGERMPAKSTYFYPKLLSGLVINPLE